MMCSDCCKHFTGWCKSFTKTEVFLCVLQVIFLVVFIAFLTFLILHLEVCSRNKQRLDGPRSTELHCNSNQTTNNINTNNEFESSTDSLNSNKGHVTNQDETKHPYKKLGITDKILVNAFDTAVKCTWKPSEKTEAFTHYYEYNQTVQVTKADEEEMPTLLEDNILLEDSTDGKEIYDSRKDFLLALVKIKPPQVVTFGCTLTIVSEFWTLTAASCIEAIEEVDSLDSFVMMQGLKDEKQKIYPVEDIMIHPQYEGVNFTYDLAALKSESRLVKKDSLLVTLPSMVDYFLITIGERLTILGYGRFRSIDREPLSRGVRGVRAHRVPPAQCARARDAGSWAPRHLRAGAAAARGACGAAPLCAGVLRARAAPCNYCAGTPLLRGRALVGVMSDGGRCGVDCEPALFVNLALVADWLRSVLDADRN